MLLRLKLRDRCAALFLRRQVPPSTSGDSGDSQVAAARPKIPNSGQAARRPWSSSAQAAGRPWSPNGQAAGRPWSFDVQAARRPLSSNGQAAGRPWSSNGQAAGRPSSCGSGNKQAAAGPSYVGSGGQVAAEEPSSCVGGGSTSLVDAGLQSTAFLCGLLVIIGVIYAAHSPRWVVIDLQLPCCHYRRLVNVIGSLCCN